EHQHRHPQDLERPEPGLHGETAEHGAVDEDGGHQRERGDDAGTDAAQKNARSTNSTTPTSRMASDEPHTMRGSQRVRRSSASAGSATATTRAWPSSTPALKPKSENSRPRAGSPSSRRAAEKPKPCTRPKQKLTTQRRPTTGLTTRFSAATAAIESAMT